MAISLQYAQPLFIEERPVGSWWRYLLLGIGLMWVMFGVTMLILMRWTGWHRMLSAHNGIILMIALFEVGMIGVLALVKSVVIVEPAVMQLRLIVAGLTLWKHTVAIKDIQSVKSEQSPKVRSVLQFLPIQINFMTAKDNVLITIYRGPKLLIGSDRADELLACLNDAIKPAAPPDSTPPHVAPSI